jgi:phosphotriesterase-related protein
MSRLSNLQRDGFIKISVNAVSLSQESKKLISAAALTHLRTGLTILSHTGYATPAFEQIDIVKSYGISPSAFVWVHAQMEKDLTTHTRAGKSEAWVSLDNVADETIDEYVKRLKQLRSDRLLRRVLISHDVGWYDPQKENGGDFVGYTAIFKKLIPALMKEGFTDKEVDQLMKINPAEAFKIRIRKM